jgi:hypothetical protein
MNSSKSNTSKVYYISMGSFWLVFGLITIFYPKMMEMFQSENGIAAKTSFSNHVMLHDGFDIVALCIILFTLSGVVVNRKILTATALAALMPTIAIIYSLVATDFWNPAFIVAGLGCFAFVIWGFILAGKAPRQSLTL